MSKREFKRKVTKLIFKPVMLFNWFIIQEDDDSYTLAKEPMGFQTIKVPKSQISKMFVEGENKKKYVYSSKPPKKMGNKRNY